MGEQVLSQLCTFAKHRDIKVDLCSYRRLGKPAMRYLQNRGPSQHGSAEEDHAIAGYGRRRRVVHVIRLKDQFRVRCHYNAIAVRQR